MRAGVVELAATLSVERWRAAATPVDSVSSCGSGRRAMSAPGSRSGVRAPPGCGVAPAIQAATALPAVAAVVGDVACGGVGLPASTQRSAAAHRLASER